MQQHGIIFLGGLHRSGTSLLFRLLRDHPRVSGFRDTGVPEDEGQLLQTVYPPGREFGGPGRFGLDARAFLDETSPLVTPDNAERLFAQWSVHWDLDRPWLLEKSPPNLVRTRFLQALFPGSRFIMLLRHPVAVTLATRKWSGTAATELIEHWLRCHERFEADRGRLEHVMDLRYEHLVTSPDAWMSRIHAFLGLEHVAADESVDSGINDRYFERWRAARARRPRDFNALIERFESRVRRFGYSLDDLSLFAPGPTA